jgi:tetratricopeptide (TPR) repeat protein
MNHEVLQKVEILMQQEKYMEARRMLEDLLAQSPDDGFIYMALAEVYQNLKEYDKALELINTAIGLEPESGDAYQRKANILLSMDRFTEADQVLDRAIELSPWDSDNYALRALMMAAKLQFQEALYWADKSLEADPQNLLGLNIRSTSLMKLNRKEESFQTIENALLEDPDNAYTHANYGWNLLERGDHHKALIHFREALRLDPDMEYARDGMADALQSRYWPYRVFMKYSFWMSDLTEKYKWAVIIGLYLALNALINLAESNETLRPYLYPLVVALTIWAFSTWITRPLSNLTLRFHPFGQYLLNDRSKMATNFVGLSLLICLVGGLGYLISGHFGWAALGGFGLTMMLPLGSMLTKRANYILPVYTGVLAILGLWAVAIAFAVNEMWSGVGLIFLGGVFIYQWVANFVIMRSNQYS